MATYEELHKLSIENPEKFWAAEADKLRVVRALPKTRSGKILRRVLKAICEKRPLDDLSTVEDGASIEEIKKSIKDMGI